MSSYKEGAIHQLADALETAGFSPDGITKLKQFKNLPSILDVLYGKAEIKYPEYIIDCDAAPFIPEGWTVEEHKKGGIWKFDTSRISLYISKDQKNGNIVGNEVQKELKGLAVMNANVLDYLLAHPELIPEEWKRGKIILFWGTIYRDSAGELSVRNLSWDGGRWYWSYCQLSRYLNFSSPAALIS